MVSLWHLTWSKDGTARVWDATDGKALAVMAHSWAVEGARFSENGQHILTWGGEDYQSDDSVQIWDASNGRIFGLKA